MTAYVPPEPPDGPDTGHVTAKPTYMSDAFWAARATPRIERIGRRSYVVTMGFHEDYVRSVNAARRRLRRWERQDAREAAWRNEVIEP